MFVMCVLKSVVASLPMSVGPLPAGQVAKSLTLGQATMPPSGAPPVEPPLPLVPPDPAPPPPDAPPAPTAPPAPLLPPDPDGVPLPPWEPHPPRSGAITV